MERKEMRKTSFEVLHNEIRNSVPANLRAEYSTLAIDELRLPIFGADWLEIIDPGKSKDGNRAQPEQEQCTPENVSWKGIVNFEKHLIMIENEFSILLIYSSSSSSHLNSISIGCLLKVECPWVSNLIRWVVLFRLEK